MGFNRIADHAIDALNPRTRNRELPAGRMSRREAWISVTIASAGFVGAAALLNPVCLWLSAPALAWILAYSYTKRFTSWSHLWLGASLAIAPAGGYLAITGAWSAPWWTLLVLCAGVLCWVAGFDMFYALQDIEFDRQQRLRSAPVLLGERGSILLAKLLHGLAIVAFVFFGLGAGLGIPWFAGVLVAAGILGWEHQLVRPGDLSRLDAAFFTSNGVMSIVVFAGALADRLV
jgi:4-hydroxybenzoate polyprenyltransferase